MEMPEEEDAAPAPLSILEKYQKDLSEAAEAYLAGLHPDDYIQFADNSQGEREAKEYSPPAYGSIREWAREYNVSSSALNR
jgi:hypothetical protein